MTTYIGAAEASRLLGVTKPTLYAYVSRGLLARRAADDGRTSLYARDDVDRLLERSRRTAATEQPTIDVEIASAITRLDDDRLTYRGHDVAQLARESHFEQVAELLWSGALPAATPTWRAAPGLVARCRATADAAGTDDPLTRLALAATVVSADAEDDPALAADAAESARRLLAVVPDVLGTPRRRGPLAARLATVWHRRPSAALITAIDRALVLLADHELATSTLAVRVACSVRAAPGTALATGLQVARSPLHGAAGHHVVTLFEAAARDGAPTAVRLAASGGRHLPGFGHAVYRRRDPRVAPLLEAVSALPDPATRLPVLDAVLAEAGRLDAGLVNVDFGLGALAFVGGLPADVPLFAVARIAGWAAHFTEERSERALRYRGLTRPAPAIA